MKSIVGWIASIALLMGMLSIILVPAAATVTASDVYSIMPSSIADFTCMEGGGGTMSLSVSGSGGYRFASTGGWLQACYTATDTGYPCWIETNYYSGDTLNYDIEVLSGAAAVIVYFSGQNPFDMASSGTFVSVNGLVDPSYADPVTGDTTADLPVGHYKGSVKVNELGYADWLLGINGEMYITGVKIFAVAGEVIVRDLSISKARTTVTTTAVTTQTKVPASVTTTAAVPSNPATTTRAVSTVVPGTHPGVDNAGIAKTEVEGVRWFPCEDGRENDLLWEAECYFEGCMCQGFGDSYETTGYDNYLSTEYHADGSLTLTRTGADGNDFYWPRIRTLMLDSYPAMDWTVADTLYFDIEAVDCSFNVMLSIYGLNIKLGKEIADACGVTGMYNSDADTPAGRYIGAINIQEALTRLAAENGTESSVNALAIQNMGTNTVMPQVSIFYVGGMEGQLTIRNLFMSSKGDVDGANCDYADIGLVFGDGFYDNITTTTAPKQRTTAPVYIVTTVAGTTTLPPISPAGTTKPSTYGDFLYTLSKGEVTVTGYSGQEADVIVPATVNGYPVTAVGDYAFYGHSFMEAVTLPDSLRSIGQGAFNSCMGLQQMIIPEGVTTIGYGAFSECWNMRVIVIPGSVTSLSEFAFESYNLWHILYTGTKAQFKNIDDYLPIGYVTYHYNATGDEVQMIRRQEHCVNYGDAAWSCTLCGSTHTAEYTLPPQGHSIGNDGYCIYCDTLAEMCLSTPHPYDSNAQQLYQVTYPGVSSVSVTFTEDTCVEEDFDFIFIYDADGVLQGTYTGTELAGRTLTIKGDTVKMVLSSDTSENEYGVVVEQIVALYVQEGMGDMNGDGNLAMIDAFTLYRGLSGLMVLNTDQEAAADMNGDGYITMMDAFTLYRQVAGLG